MKEQKNCPQSKSQDWLRETIVFQQSACLVEHFSKIRKQVGYEKLKKDLKSFLQKYAEVNCSAEIIRKC